jgi:hypothetical protein
MAYAISHNSRAIDREPRQERPQKELLSLAVLSRTPEEWPSNWLSVYYHHPLRPMIEFLTNWDSSVI